MSPNATGTHSRYFTCFDTVFELFKIDSVISENILEEFTEAWKSKNLKKSISILETIEDKGYYAIDVLQVYYEYILYCDMNETLRLNVIQLIF